ncbi:hypothetical protein GPECTOR_23g121 [Gonium pectorale]|uniref:Uncharacterized protein n=1 Tax=Gonium pectorale TaxID=33097 RepID=A0A150GGT5_GONPE|nr:hypothetical protein GPECTOR_23g121 [Gonium pectorale]|eukprot:KXZ49034.1 hypothetical protein GPECTOR_23g121 [Gonium pectorale]
MAAAAAAAQVAAAVRRLLTYAFTGQPGPLDPPAAAEWMRAAAVAVRWSGPRVVSAQSEAAGAEADAGEHWGLAMEAPEEVVGELDEQQQGSHGLMATTRALASRALAGVLSPSTPAAAHSLPTPRTAPRRANTEPAGLPGGEAKAAPPAPAASPQSPHGAALELLDASARLPPGWVPPALLDACLAELGRAAAGPASADGRSGSGGMLPPDAAATLRCLAALRYVPDATLLQPVLALLCSEYDIRQILLLHPTTDDAVPTPVEVGETREGWWVAAAWEGRRATEALRELAAVATAAAALAAEAECVGAAAAGAALRRAVSQVAVQVGRVLALAVRLDSPPLTELVSFYAAARDAGALDLPLLAALVRRLGLSGWKVSGPPLEELAGALVSARELVELTAAPPPAEAGHGGSDAGSVGGGGRAADARGGGDGAVAVADAGALDRLQKLTRAALKHLVESDFERLSLEQLVGMVQSLQASAGPSGPTPKPPPPPAPDPTLDTRSGGSHTAPHRQPAESGLGSWVRQLIAPQPLPPPLQSEEELESEEEEEKEGGGLGTPWPRPKQWQLRARLFDRLLDALAARLLARGDGYVAPLGAACASLRRLAAAGALRARPELAAALHESVGFRLEEDADGAALGDVCAALAIGCALEPDSAGLGGAVRAAAAAEAAPVRAAAAADPWVAQLVSRGLLDELAGALQRRLRLAPQEFGGGELAAMAVRAWVVKEAVERPGAGAGADRRGGGGRGGLSGGAGVTGGAPGAGRLLRVLARGLSARCESLSREEVLSLTAVFARCRPHEAALLQRLTEAAAAAGAQYTPEDLLALAEALYAGGATAKQLYAPLAKQLRARAEEPGGGGSGAAASLLRAVRMAADANALEQAFVRAMRAA